ncbi:sporulation histidine kinase inhibitor Sda [Paenibacillus mendelii]|uniref:Sporulation histidine kinase inhibitor Sda n=1 Tax=Paenibacillus mendelii TaxID=206163 RepID=A0ABV6JMM1_9BACL|nr:sporulation histidine kinase inhibitor Sda [Paenibacillus mendelii]MCQ6558704.1 sporulation histidine kinase inhibitor Sda [Paenibacillus mendelii]
MEILSDELLIDAYHAAIQFSLESEFIILLVAEMKRRQINPDNYRITA